MMTWLDLDGNIVQLPGPLSLHKAAAQAPAATHARGLGRMWSADAEA